MRKLITFIAITFLLLSLSACSNNDELLPNATTTLPTEVTTTATEGTQTTRKKTTAKKTTKKATPTTKKTTTKKTTTTTTKEPTTTTTSSSAILITTMPTKESTTFSSSSTVIITTTTQSSTTDIDKFYIEQSAFWEQYDLALEQYNAEIEEDIRLYEEEKDEWLDLWSEYHTQHVLDERFLQERYANMGLLNSGSYQSAINNLNQKYRSIYTECTNNTQLLQKEIDRLKSEKENPNINKILAIIAYNNNYTADEVLDKYYNFME